MLADDTTSITTGGACFTAEAWAERTVFHWQIFFAEDLVAMIVGDRNLCSWDQIVVGVLKMEHIFCEFWQLTGAEIRRTVGHVWRDELGIAVLVGVHIDHERNDRAFETGSQTFVEGETAAGNFCSTVEIENVEVDAEIPVCFWFKIKFAWFAPDAFNAIIVFAAVWNVVGWHVWNADNEITHFFFKGILAFVEDFDLFVDGRNFRHQIVGAFAVALALTNFLALRVALALQLFDLRDDFAMLFICGQKWLHVNFFAATADSLSDAFWFFAHKFDI